MEDLSASDHSVQAEKYCNACDRCWSVTLELTKVLILIKELIRQARRVDSVEGGSFMFGRYFLAPEALTRAPKARASRGVWGHAPPHEILQI